MASGDGVRPARHLGALFLGTTFMLLTTLGWLGWQSLQQDRRVEAQLVRDRLESATDLIAAQIRQQLADTEEELNRLAATPADELRLSAPRYGAQLREDALLVVFEAGRVTAHPAGRLLYYPELPEPAEPPAEVFAFGEALEFKDRDPRRAIAVFEKLAGAADDAVRAGALVRLARNQRKAGQSDAAMATYARLAELRGVFLGGWPADLRARKTRCDLLEQLGRTGQLRVEAAALDDDLHSGRWPLTRATFVFLTAEIQRWAPSGTARGASNGSDDGAARGAALAVAASVDALWLRWHRDPTAFTPASARGGVTTTEGTVSLFSRSTATRLVALIAGRRHLEQALLTPLRDLFERYNVGVVLADAEGQTLLAHSVTDRVDAQGVVKTIAETRLPWTLRVVSADPEADVARLAARRWLLIGGLGLLALLAVASSYFSIRAMTREIQAARLQSEFVAAVSHEFRTPLTSLRQFTDLLADGRVSSEADRQKYYFVLQRGTRRLTRLVENLLDFGRMEAGFYRFVLEPVRARELLERVVAEFADEGRQRGYEVDWSWAGPPDAVIAADEAALGRAIWNLLDNAVKYSPECRTIWAEGRAADGAVTIAVRDRGIGIPVAEQRAIFVKFVRGALPSGYTIKGTGLGLALVDQIVQAHGGTVTVASAPGQGSTFTVTLPAPASVAAAAPTRSVAEART